MLRDLDKQTYTEYEAMNVAPSQPTQTPSLSTTPAVETIKPFYLFPENRFPLNAWASGQYSTDLSVMAAEILLQGSDSPLLRQSTNF